jgi:Na+/proline symporter
MNIDTQHEHSTLLSIDIVVFCLSLALSLSVGIYHAIASRRRVALIDKQGYQSQSAETDEYLMGGHNMPLIPVGLSLISSFLSGILMIAVPGEIFERGLKSKKYL